MSIGNREQRIQKDTGEEKTRVSLLLEGTKKEKNVVQFILNAIQQETNVAC
jgi:hypothetical protein